MNLHPTRAVENLTPLMSERRVGIIGACLVALGPLSLALFTPAMPELVRAFGTTEAWVKYTLTSYMAGFAIAQLVCGPLSDGLGRKPVTYAFLGIYIVASVLAVLSPTIEMLVAARFLQGVGAAIGLSIARAVVRDLFTADQAVRVMSLVVLILGVGPSLAPFLGGLLMQVANWQAIFATMVVMGVAILLVVRFAMVETVARDPSRINPRAVARSYRMLGTDRYFLLSSLIVASPVGALFTLAAVLPFILMDGVGLSPAAFGLAMFLQSGMIFVGTFVVRLMIGRRSVGALIRDGILIILAASLMVPLSLYLGGEPSLVSVMGPIAVFSFGVAFVLSTVSTVALGPFPSMAGSAAALGGFMQMTIGMGGGIAAALLGDPVLAMAVLMPLLGFVGALAWFLWRRMPEPPLAGMAGAAQRLPEP